MWCGRERVPLRDSDLLFRMVRVFCINFFRGESIFFGSSAQKWIRVGFGTFWRLDGLIV